MATLKISDLSVGDWVGYNGKSYRTVIVDALDQTATIFGNDEQGDIHIEQLAPIPITAEILGKNGWSTDGMYAFLRIDEHLHLEYYYHEHRLRKYYCGVDEWQNHTKANDIVFQAHCYSVHQLQHALRLAGVDKEINL